MDTKPSNAKQCYIVPIDTNESPNKNTKTYNEQLCDEPKSPKCEVLQQRIILQRCTYYSHTSD